MPLLALDSFDAPLQWAALDPALAPSGEIALTPLNTAHPFAASTGAMEAQISSAAIGHRISLATPATDLNALEDLALWVRSASSLGTSPGADFLMRIELGSVAMPIGAPGNDWHRYVGPLSGQGWSYLRFALDDLPAAVRAAVTEIAIIVDAVSSSHTVVFDALEAQIRRTVDDLETSLLGLLDGQFLIGGVPVPAVIPPDAPANPANPFFRIEPIRSTPCHERAVETGSRSDFTDSGYRIRPTPEPWDYFYAIDAVASTRAQVAQMLDFLAFTLDQHGRLPIGNRALRMDPVDASVAQPAADIADNRHFIRVNAWVERGPSITVAPTQDFQINLEALEPVLADGDAP